jgi:hypothetical protein
MIYNEFLGIVGTNVNLVGKVNLALSVKETYRPMSKVIIEAANITLLSDAEVSAGYTLLHANETILMEEGAKIFSLRKNTCNIDSSSSSKDLFVCIKPNTLENTLTENLVTVNFREQFPKQDKLETFSSVLTGLMHNYTTYLISYKEIGLYSALVEGPRIGICTTNLTLVDSSIETSGHGCLGDEGLGRGR